MKSGPAEIPDEFLAQLKENLACRRVERGMRLLEEHRDLLTQFDPESQNAGRFVGYLAQWVDLGFRRPSLIREILARFSKPVRSRLPLIDYLYLRMAQGMFAMSQELKKEAIGHFDFVLSLGDDTDDRELVAIANFWKGRCLRM